MTTLAGLWVGSQLPKSARLCIKSHLDHGFGFRLFVYPHLWKGDADVPAGCEIVDANAVLEKDNIYKQRSFNSYSPFVDWWRYTYQYEAGEPVIDLDMICMRPWELKHWAYYTADRRQVMIGWLNFPAKHPLMQDLYESFLYPNSIEAQARWIREKHPTQYDDDSSLPLKDQLRKKWYGWCGSDWIANGVSYYQIQEHIGTMLWTKYFPPSQWEDLFNGVVRPEDPRLGELNELHLHGHRIFNYGNTAIFDRRSEDSVFAYLWNKHFS